MNDLRIRLVQKVNVERWLSIMKFGVTIYGVCEKQVTHLGSIYIMLFKYSILTTILTDLFYCYSQLSKPLSRSTPSMTVGSGSQTPSIVSRSSTRSSPTSTSSARQKKFHRHFTQVIKNFCSYYKHCRSLLPMSQQFFSFVLSFYCRLYKIITTTYSNVMFHLIHQGMVSNKIFYQHTIYQHIIIE